MKLFSNGSDYVGARRSLYVDRRGVTINYECPRVGGGYYVHDSLTIAWPWVNLNK